MGILHLTKRQEYQEADFELVMKALAGRYTDQGGFYRSLYLDRKARLNWGHLYRALKRLYASGYITQYTLLKNGDLSVRFFSEYKAVEHAARQANDYIPCEQLSCVYSLSDDDKDIRVKGISRIPNARDEKSASHYLDIVPPRVEVEARIRKNHTDLFTNESIAKRARAFKAETSACDMWAPKFKLNPDYYRKEPLADVRPLSVKIKEIQDRNGYCVWPSAYYKPLN